MAIPSSRFALIVALSGVGFVAWSGRSWTALILVQLVLLTIFGIDALTSVSPHKIRVFREHPASIALGETAQISWAIENHASVAVRATVTDALWPSLRSTRRSVGLRLAAHGRHVATAELWPSRRGRFPLDSITVRVQTRWGLSSRRRTHRVSSVVRVLPAFPSRDELQRRMRQPRLIDVGLRTLRIKGSGTDFDQLRDYQPGDDPRRMDWPATARLQKPIVRQYRAERNQSVVLLLDNGRIMASSVADVPRVEHAMDAALGLTQVAIGLGDKVGMVTFDRQIRTVVPSNSSRAQQARISEAMYLLEPDLNESAYQAALVYAAARFRRRSLYVVLTDLAESVVEEAILPALATLSRRHLVVVAAVSDPLLNTWAVGTNNGSASEIFRQAAAISMLQQRRRNMVRLRAGGAIVIDAPPGELAHRVVDTYLELKASGRL